MSTEYKDPRRDAHKDREDYIKSQNEHYTVKGGMNTNAEIVNAVNQYVDEVNQNKGLDSIRIQDDAAITQVGDVGGGTTDGSATTTQIIPLTPSGLPTASNTNPDIVAKIDPAIVKETPKEVVKRAKDADEWARYIDSLYSESDREADEKKKKAARWITAAQMLGDSIAALGNSWATASGANAMALAPGAVKAAAATHQLEQDIRNAREKAAKAKMDATLKKYEMEMNEKRYADALKQQGIENTIKLGNLEISRAKLANDMEYQKQMLDLRAKELIQNGVKADQAFKLSMEELGLKKEQIKLDKDELQARINGTYYSGSGRGSSKLDPVKTSQGDMLIDETKLNPTNLAQYAELANQSGDSELAKAIANLDGGTRSISALKQELGKILQDPANKAIVDHMVSNGILVANTKSGQNNGGKILGLK